jgi:hypothetical protein
MRNLAIAAALFLVPSIPFVAAAQDAVQPPSQSPAESPLAPPAEIPAPPAQEATTAQPTASGQWIYTQQYGWVWSPYGDAYSYVPPSGEGEPYEYVYYPAYGWEWVAAPWIWGIGPWPYFGVFGAGHFGWYGHGWWRSPARWHYHPGGFRGGLPSRGFASAPFRGGFAPHGTGSASYRGGFGGHGAPSGQFAGRGFGGGRPSSGAHFGSAGHASGGFHFGGHRG